MSSVGGGEPLTRGAQLAMYVEILKGWGVLERVIARVDEGTRSFLESPPAAWEWLPLRHNVALFVAVEGALGRERTQALAYEASRGSIREFVRPVAELALETFGATPATLFTRANTLLRFSTRGQALQYRERSATSGELEIRVMGLRPPEPFFVAWTGIVLTTIELCGKRGTVSVGRVEESGEDGVGFLDVAWE